MDTNSKSNLSPVRALPFIGGTVSLFATAIPLLVAFFAELNSGQLQLSLKSATNSLFFFLVVVALSLVPYLFLWLFHRDRPQYTRLHVVLFLFVLIVGVYTYYDSVFVHPDLKFGWGWGLIATPMSQTVALTLAFAICLLVERVKGKKSYGHGPQS